MEHSVENSDGAEIGKKSRSLDLQSIYESRVSEEVLSNILKRKRLLDGANADGEAVKRKRKSRKEVSLSSFGKKSRKSLDKVYSSRGVSSASNDSGKSSRLIDSISFSLDDSGVKIPKRRRGFVGKKKEVNLLSRPAEATFPCSSRISAVEEANKLLGCSGDTVVSTRKKRKKASGEFKESRLAGSNSEEHNTKKVHAASVINNGDTSSRKHFKDRRKKKHLESPSFAKEDGPSTNKHNRLCNDLQDDDEENLEQNAARMLSSRFDPSCTGFSSSRKSHGTASKNGLAFLMSGQDFDRRGVKSAGGSKSASLDSAGRVLRPRKQRKERGLSRKRRHFYEILFKDLDACWVLNRRIKVFWPLDQIWYFGLINDYDSERKMHHVKYDDREEEWINLRNERFKLLLLPSEVPGKDVRKKLTESNRDAGKGKADSSIEGDSFINRYLDSEPIISWLARSSRQIKSTPLGARKEKSSGISSASSLFSRKNDDVNERVDAGCSERNPNKLSCDHIFVDRLADAQFTEKAETVSSLCSKDEKVHRVYYRRRYRKRGQLMHHISQSNSLCKSVAESVNVVSDVDDFLDIMEVTACCREVDPKFPFWTTDNAGLLTLTIPLVELSQVRLILPVLNYTFEVDHCLLGALLLLNCGTVMAMWPIIHLEMLFVDDDVGLRFLLFEGCVKQAVVLVFLVLTAFHRPNEQENQLDMQKPVTSIRFKLSCLQNLKRQLVFTFYNFTKLNPSKWLYLDHKLGRRCLLMQQLPLSECTYDNVKAFQTGSTHFALTPVCGKPTSIEGSWKRSRQDIYKSGVPTESSANVSKSFGDEEHVRVPTFALSFTAAPSFFLNLHLKLLLERSAASISLQEWEHWKQSTYMTVDCSSNEGCSREGPQLTTQNDVKSLSMDAGCPKLFSAPTTCFGSVPLSVCSSAHEAMFLQKYQTSVTNACGGSSSSPPPVKFKNSAPSQMQNGQCSHLVSKCDNSARSSVPGQYSSHSKPDITCHSCLNGLTVDIQQSGEEQKPDDKLRAQQSSDLCWSINGGVIRSPNPTAPRSMWHRNRNSSNSSSFAYLSQMWPDGKADLFRNGFSNKKPRTQVSYMPFGGHDINTRHRSLQYKGLSHKRIRRANVKRINEDSRSSKRDLELSCCNANLLITASDKGWREQGALIVLELADHNEWRLAIKVSGTTRYTYKAHQFVQPGTTNRYTHDMMWRGGKDWTLEFPDRSQWILFKEMHEECYSRNLRAGSNKNIPIPGVRVIEDNDENGNEVPFVRIPLNYYRQLEIDVDMAMNPSRILYDMDSEDEKWILNCKSDVSKSSVREISEEVFEKAMDMFEKAAYAQQRDEFTSEELCDLSAGVGPADVVRSIHKHWKQKRQSKGMPLIRQLQPPLWERYQQRMNEYMLAMTKVNTAFSNGCQDKVCPVEKPPMFAFCLKPRGLEMPNRGSKHRTQKRVSLSQHSNAFSGDQDSFHGFGRKFNGFALVDEKGIFSGPCHEHSDASARVFSPRDAGCTGYFSMSSSDGSERNLYPRFHRSRSRKMGTFLSSNDRRLAAVYSPRSASQSNGVHRVSMGMPEWPSQKHYYSGGTLGNIGEQLDDSDLDEFRLRDASGAAQHALNMAKLKREKAQRLLYKADLAIQKAVGALMTAEAIKASSENSGDDG